MPSFTSFTGVAILTFHSINVKIKVNESLFSQLLCYIELAENSLKFRFVLECTRYFRVLKNLKA
jgi:hypothetical protein